MVRADSINVKIADTTLSPISSVRSRQPGATESNDYQKSLRNQDSNGVLQENNQFSDKDKESLNQAVDGLNQTMSVFDRSLKFSVHEDTNRIMVQVIDRSDNDRVIREIPPEKILDMIAEMKDMIGVLIDRRV